jgi:hypothetical protein
MYIWWVANPKHLQIAGRAGARDSASSLHKCKGRRRILRQLPPVHCSDLSLTLKSEALLTAVTHVQDSTIWGAVATAI